MHQLPTDDAKFDAQMLVVGEQTFSRSHPLSERVRQAMQWTVKQKDGYCQAVDLCISVIKAR